MIVGLHGRMRVGKDVAASALVRDLGFHRVAFADKLKELAIEANPLVWPREQPLNVDIGAGRLAREVHRQGWEQAKSISYVREFLQDLGLGARRVFGDDFWIDHLDLTRTNTVVPDVRFRNEATWLRERGALLIKISRPGAGLPSRHQSENDLDDWTDWDLIVDNSGSIADLEAEVVKFVEGRMRTGLRVADSADQ